MRFAFRLRRAFSFRSEATVLVATLGAGIGCTSVLGIDGPYALEAADDVGGRTSSGKGGRGSGGDRIALATGGSGAPEDADVRSDPDASGPSVGGGGAGGTSVENRDAGCAQCAPPCIALGLYQGTFDGVHAAAVTVVGVPLPISAGDLEFRISGQGSTLQVGAGTLKGNFAWGDFTGTLAGSYDCATGTLSAQMHGVINSTLKITVAGTLTGQIDGDPKTRVWAEQEPGFTAKPGNTAGLGTGAGTWQVAWKSK